MIAPYDLSEDPAAINIGHQDTGSVCRLCHGKIDQVMCLQIHLTTTSGPFHHDHLIFPGQFVVGFHDDALQSGFEFIIINRIQLAKHLALKNNLGPRVAGGFEKDRVHMDRWQEPGRLGLNHLGTSNLPPFNGYKGVVGHVLGLKRRHLVAPFLEYPTKCGSGDGFTHIAAGPQKHDGLGHYPFPFLKISFSALSRMSPSCLLRP